MTVLEKIAALRAAMEAEGADGVYVPSSDPHMTEYLPARWRCRAWLSGFTGSAGTLCVTREAAALWTDGRYFIQAERQLEGSGITLMRMAQPGVPTVEGMAGGQDARRRNAGTGRRLHQCVRGGIAGKSAGGKKSCPA